MSFYDPGPLRFHSQLHTEVLWDIPSVYQKTLDPIWVSGIYFIPHAKRIACFPVYDLSTLLEVNPHLFDQNESI